jgi:hypothetical protein
MSAICIAPVCRAAAPKVVVRSRTTARASAFSGSVKAFHPLG